MDESDFINCPRCHCTNTRSSDHQFIIDDPLPGINIVGYKCQQPDCYTKIIDYQASNFGPLYRELGQDEDIDEPGMIKEIRFTLYLKKFWMGEVTRFPHTGKGMPHGFDLKARDPDGNLQLFEVVSTYGVHGGYRLQTYNKNWRDAQGCQKNEGY